MIDRLAVTLEDLRYCSYFYFHAARGVCRKQKLKLDQDLPELEEEWVFSKRLRDRWHNLYSLPETDLNVFLPYYFRSVEKFFLVSMNSLGFNYRNVLHLSHSRWVEGKGTLPFQVGMQYKVKSKLRDISILSHNRIVLANETSVLTSNGKQVMGLVDYVFLKNIDLQDLKKIPKSHAYHPSSLDQLKSLSKRKSRLSLESQSVKKIPIYFKGDLGWKYGLVSGDLNPVHTNSVLAKMFGYSRPFIQGVCTANIIAHRLCFEFERSMDRFTIYFCRPIFLDQWVTLLVNANDYELVDSENSVLAAGTFQTQT